MPIICEPKICLLLMSKEVLLECSKECVCVHTLPQRCLVSKSELWGCEQGHKEVRCW